MHTFQAAGHNFVDDVCTYTKTHEDGTAIPCGKKWVSIMNVDMTYVDADGYAHYGKLSRTEIESVIKERERRRKLFEDATRGVSTGGSVGTTEAAEVVISED